jgi:hypothetical protein
VTGLKKCPSQISDFLTPQVWKKFWKLYHKSRGKKINLDHWDKWMRLYGDDIYLCDRLRLVKKVS